MYLILCILLLLYIINPKKIYESMSNKSVESTLDKRSYKISSSFNDMSDAANKLSYLNQFIINFLRYAKKKYIIGVRKTHTQFYIRMLNNYNMDTIFENNPKYGEETSFVTNKGDEFGICLRDKGNNSDKFHNENILQFVMLHELTHLGCISYGHDKEFWSMFKVVLEDAAEFGIYTPINYAITPINYCGLLVTYNPYFSEKPT